MRRLSAVVAAATVVLALGPAVASAEPSPSEDPNLDQTIATDQPTVHGEHVLETGHVDMGPRFEAGQWRFLIHDDAARTDTSATSVWRYPDETVMRVVDAAAVEVPDDPTYGFLGAEPGQQVWVVPQTQDPDVLWLGWNTQDPQVLQQVSRGISLSLTGAQGPGVVTVYLQSGSFAEPQVLWDSRQDEDQPAWVDINTHTHANWVFTAPGVYLLQLRAEADLVDGSSVSDTQVIRFAVGTDTSTDEALSTKWLGPGGGPAASPGGEDAEEPTGSRGTALLVPLLVGAVVVLLVVVTVVTVRSSRTRRRVLAGRAAPGITTSKAEEGDTRE